MSVCYYEVNNNNFFMRRKIPVDNYKFNNIKMITVHLNSDKLINIIKPILSDFCNADVIGFDKRTNKYWCKIFENNCCILNMELEMIYKDKDNSFVRFVLLVGIEVLMNSFISNFKECIQLYKTSSFIRACLDEI
jgi:hypothetical protein